MYSLSVLFYWRSFCITHLCKSSSATLSNSSVLLFIFTRTAPEKMLARVPRAALRSTRPIRQQPHVQPRLPRNLRFQSTGPAKSTKESSGISGDAIWGGVAGGGVAFLAGYLWYHFSGARSTVNSISKTKAYADNAFKKATDAAPEPGQALQWLKETVTSYTKMIPGASKYVDSAFEDLEKVREKHGDDVDKIIKETYGELKDVTKAGFSAEAAVQAWDVIQHCFKRISSLASSAAEDILNNHPELKKQFQGNFEQLQKMGEQYGPEAKKAVDETWQQVRDLVASGGLGASTMSQLQNLLQEKTQQVKTYGEQAWQKGMEQAKPLLDKQPQLKKLFEENKQKLLRGDVSQLWKKVSDAAKSGNTEDLQKFAKEQIDQVSKSTGGESGSGTGIEQFLQMLPGGSEIAPKLQQLQELSEKHGKEAEKLVKSAVEDIKKVLAKKVEEGQELKEKVEEDAKGQGKGR